METMVKMEMEIKKNYEIIKKRIIKHQRTIKLIGIVSLILILIEVGFSSNQQIGGFKRAMMAKGMPKSMPKGMPSGAGAGADATPKPKAEKLFHGPLSSGVNVMASILSFAISIILIILLLVAIPTAPIVAYISAMYFIIRIVLDKISIIL